MAEKLEIGAPTAPDGTVRLEPPGLRGQACLAETEAVEKALGTVRSRTRTAEWYQQATAVRGKATQR